MNPSPYSMPWREQRGNGVLEGRRRDAYDLGGDMEQATVHHVDGERIFAREPEEPGAAAAREEMRGSDQRENPECLHRGERPQPLGGMDSQEEKRKEPDLGTSFGLRFLVRYADFLSRPRWAPRSRPNGAKSTGDY